MSTIRLAPIVEGSVLRYFDSGVRDQGSSRCYVLIPGMGGTIRHWTAVVPELVGRGHRVIAIDFPALSTGLTDGTRGEGSASAHFSLALATLMESLDADDAVLVGHSLGGALALATAAITRSPRTVVLVSGTLFGISAALSDPRRAPVTLGQSLNFATQLAGATLPLPAAVKRMIARPGINRAMLRPYVHRPAALPQSLLDEVLSDGGLVSIAEALSVLNVARQEPLQRVVPPPDTTIDLIWGANDKLIAQSDIDTAEQRLHPRRLQAIPECGHWPAVEAPSALSQFLLSVEQESHPAGRKSQADEVT